MHTHGFLHYVQALCARLFHSSVVHQLISVKARASECWSVCGGLEDWRAKYKQIIAGGAMIVKEFCDFRAQRKQCDFIICDVLSERLPVRLAEGSYLLNFFYIFFETAFFLGA